MKTSQQLSIICAACAAPFAFAQQAATTAVVPAAATASAPVQAVVVKPAAAPAQNVAEASVASANQDAQIVISASAEVKTAFDEFAQRKGITYGVPDAMGITYYKASDVVTVKKLNPDFLNHRAMSFAKAFDEIKVARIKYRYGTILSHTEHEIANDKNAEKTPESLTAQPEDSIAAKVKALAEAKLDKGLLELGVDPTQYAKNIEVKRQAYLNKIMQDAMIRAVGSCAGLSVVTTVEGRGTEGVYAIGVIAKYDPAFEEIASAMHRKVRPVVVPKAGVPVTALLKGLPIQNFGVRFYYDEKGEPALLSFGQWASGYTGKDPVEKEQQDQIALKQAEDLANIAMSEFISGQTAYEDNDKLGDLCKKLNILDANGIKGSEKINDIISTIKLASKTTASDSLRGRRPVFNEILSHPDGAGDVAVVAVNWSYTQLDQTVPRQITRDPTPVPSTAAEQNQPAGVRVGDEFDF